MGSVSAQKAWRVLKNTQTVVAIELLCAAQGLDFARTYKGPGTLKSGKGIEAAYRYVRRRVPRLEKDRVLYDDIRTLRDLVGSDVLINVVERITGPLK